MRKYLAGLDRKLPLLVETVALKKGGARFVAGAWPLTAERIAKSLRLEIVQAKDGLKVRLRNAGKAPMRVVRPDDGSEAGMREPTVYFAARRGKAEWKRGGPLPRCGLFAPNRPADVVELKPGASLEIGAPFLPPHLTFDLKTPGRVDIRAHYAYKAGLPAMGKTPAFELVSAPVTLTVG